MTAAPMKAEKSLLFNSENLFKIYFFFNDPYGFQHVHGIYPDFKFSKMIRAVF